MRLPLLLVLLSFAVGPALAGPIEDGEAALDRGDYATALRLWKPLADKGNAEMQFRLGFIHENNIGRRPRQEGLREALSWYRKAAEQGHAAAQFNVGIMLEYGHGTPADPVQAYMWLDLAATRLKPDDMAQPLAAAGRERVGAKLTPEQRAEAQRLARAWKPGTAP